MHASGMTDAPSPEPEEPAPDTEEPAAEPEEPPEQEEPPDTAELLASLTDAFNRYVIFPSPAARDAVVLWTAHTHVAFAFDSTPRLAVLSREPGSGKSRVLEVLQHTCPAAFHADDATPAVLWRTIDAGFPTILLDECDNIFGRNGSDSAHRQLRAIINAGHHRNGSVPRTIGAESVHHYRVFAPCAMAGLGTLPETILTRSVVIRMRKRRRGETIEGFRAKHAVPLLAELRERLEEWSADAVRKLSVSDPILPVQDRAADVWEPLIAIADLAGGDWPDRAREACVQLTGGNDTPTPEQQLLTDVREAVGDADRMFTEDLLTALRAQWPTLTARSLARMLAGHGIRPTTIRDGERIAKGYYARDLAPQWPSEA